MSNDEARRVIEAQAQALGPTLHAGMAVSLAAAGQRMRGLAHDRYPHLLPLTMRAEFREYLEREAVPNGWALGGDSRAMGQLLLQQSELGLEMRFVKERRRSYPGGVPTAGSNSARRQRWTQGPLDFLIPDAPQSVINPVNLLLCWDFASREKLDEFRLRIVHTLAPGTYGAAVPCDLILDVEVGGNIFSRLKFAGSDDEEDFFNVEITEEENGF
jgi:hypothetical protein